MEASAPFTSKTHWLDEKVSQWGRHFSSRIIWWRWHFQKRETPAGRFKSCWALQSFPKAGKESIMIGRNFNWFVLCGNSCMIASSGNKSNTMLLLWIVAFLFTLFVTMCTVLSAVVLWWPATIASLRSVKDPTAVRKLGVMYFPTNGGAKEPQNLPNHRVV